MFNKCRSILNKAAIKAKLFISQAYKHSPLFSLPRSMQPAALISNACVVEIYGTFRILCGFKVFEKFRVWGKVYGQYHNSYRWFCCTALHFCQNWHDTKIANPILVAFHEMSINFLIQDKTAWICTRIVEWTAVFFFWSSKYLPTTQICKWFYDLLQGMIPGMQKASPCPVLVCRCAQLNTIFDMLHYPSRDAKTVAF